MIIRNNPPSPAQAGDVRLTIGGIMTKKAKLQPTAKIAQSVVEGVAGIRDPVAAVLWAEKKGYKSGHKFTFRGKKCRVWQAGHYAAYFNDE
ncbi:hypothetical protein [uncultured Amphritea sp.]|uniref:hypothetical protein n=1 Tax=uncultured Amphritea sp. TaxID=981605 RepID=UPI0025CBC245|nr:hypothetical protein [uncultured Amphritea sp.]